jgi:type IV pilus assembly protein PilE
MCQRGLTLIELLVVLIVVGVLAAFALSGWRQHLHRVHRTEAVTALYDLLAAQERHYLRHSQYTGDITAAPPQGLGMAAVAGHYRLTVELSTDAQTFIARATPEGGAQAGDADCGVYSLDHRGRREVQGRRGVVHCWR